MSKFTFFKTSIRFLQAVVRYRRRSFDFYRLCRSLYCYTWEEQSLPVKAKTPAYAGVFAVSI